MNNVFELKLDFDRKNRVKENLEKNFERRKRLNLLEEDYERSIKKEIRELESELSILSRKIRSIESEKSRKKLL
jgi:polyhydroxyalkanoate synthesis regulator phasin